MHGKRDDGAEEKDEERPQENHRNCRLERTRETPPPDTDFPQQIDYRLAYKRDDSSHQDIDNDREKIP